MDMPNSPFLFASLSVFSMLVITYSILPQEGHFLRKIADWLLDFNLKKSWNNSTMTPYAFQLYPSITISAILAFILSVYVYTCMYRFFLNHLSVSYRYCDIALLYTSAHIFEEQGTVFTWSNAIITPQLTVTL